MDVLLIKQYNNMSSMEIIREDREIVIDNVTANVAVYAMLMNLTAITEISDGIGERFEEKVIVRRFHNLEQEEEELPLLVKVLGIENDEKLKKMLYSFLCRSLEGHVAMEWSLDSWRSIDTLQCDITLDRSKEPEKEETEKTTVPDLDRSQFISELAKELKEGSLLGLNEDPLLWAIDLAFQMEEMTFKL